MRGVKEEVKGKGRVEKVRKGGGCKRGLKGKGRWSREGVKE